MPKKPKEWSDHLECKKGNIKEDMEVEVNTKKDREEI